MVRGSTSLFSMHTQNQMDRSNWNVRVSYRSDPQQLKASARKRLILAIPLTVVTIGLVYVAVTVSALLWILVAISALGALIWWSLWYGEFRAASWTGDDLIDLEVADQGIVVQGGLAIPWSQVAAVSYTWQQQEAVTGRGIGSRLGTAAATAAVEAAGFDRVVRSMEFSVRDADGLRARATSKPQRDAVMPRGKDGLGTAHVGLSGVKTPAEMENLIGLVASLCQANQIPFTRAG